eukprot:scaffold23111_cov117-Isochrysis_galbana.AAC.2
MRRTPPPGKMCGEEQNVQHPAFPRGPPPQYYPGSTWLNFAVRLGSGDSRAMWPHMVRFRRRKNMIQR